MTALTVQMFCAKNVNDNVLSHKLAMKILDLHSEK